MMTVADLERYLHRQIPLSAAMQVSVRAAGTGSVVLAAPLEPNINHKSTAFGGSVSALAILAAWSVLHLRLLDEGLTGEIVIQSNRMDYQRPITGPFTATSALVDPSAWPAFLAMLTRKGRARIEIGSVVAQGDSVAGRLTGRFVALSDLRASDSGRARAGEDDRLTAHASRCGVGSPISAMRVRRASARQRA